MQEYPSTSKRITALISADKILKSTCKLFLIDELNKKPHGCAILFTYNSKYYCLTNAHVLNKKMFPKVYILTKKNESVLLDGGLLYSEPNIGNNLNNDTFDVGIMELTEDVKDKFISLGYIFLEYNKIETSVNLLRTTVIMIAAYPDYKIKIDSKTNSLKIDPVIVRTIPVTKDYSNLGFPKAYHHVVEYPIKSFKETSIEQRMIINQPHGMSGSGLWALVGKSELDYEPF